MKKNMIAIDFVNFGEEAENTSKLEAFVANVTSSENSHLTTIPPGPHLLSDLLLTTPILGDESGGGGEGNAGGEGGASGGGGGGFEFGVDPHLDPELALALRMSLEEENARQEKERKEKEVKEQAEGSSNALGSVQEEDENAPLLGSSKDEGAKDKKGGDDDKMDTA